MINIKRAINKFKKFKLTPDKVATTVVWLFIFAYAISILMMYVWILSSSFKTNRIEFATNIFGWPKELKFDNYAKALENFSIPIMRNRRQVTVYLDELLPNSLMYVFGCSIAATLCPAIVSYVTAKFDFKFNRVVDGIVIITMVLPIIGSDAAMIQMTKTLNLYNKMLGMVFMKFTFLGFNYLLLKQSFKSVDRAYSEAAFLDGASEFRVMVSINFPMVANVLMIVFTLQIMGFWADWTTPLMYMPLKPTVAYALYELQFTHDPNLTFKPLQFAACILASLPMIIIFIAFRDKIMGGIAFGGLK